MADFDVFFYNQDPNGVFSTTIGGTTTYTGPASADGFATITDNEAGVRGTTLDDDDSSGTEAATANVTIGGNTSMMSERPMVAGRTYETLDYDSLPDTGAGDPVFAYLEQTGFESDGIVSGTAGDDTIDTSYLGDGDGDQIDNLDNITVIWQLQRSPMPLNTSARILLPRILHCTLRVVAGLMTLRPSR